MSHIRTTVIIIDCFYGFLLSVSITFILFGATWHGHHFRHVRELGGHEAVEEGEGDRSIPDNGNGDDAQRIDGDGQMIRRNAENVAVQWAEHIEQIFEGLDEAFN